MKKVSVTIVCYNNRGYLDGLLGSVFGQDYPDIEVVVVDNKSSDGSAEFIKENFPKVRLIVNDKNEFFCKGQNDAIRGSSGEFVLALNTDVVLGPGFISAMVAAMEGDPKTGSVSGKILRGGGERVDTTGLYLGRDRRPVERGYGELDEGGYETPGPIFGAGGAAPMYRRAMLDDVAIEGEFFDETYEMYYEDLDLAWRAARRGWKGWYTPDAVAYHLRGGSAKSGAQPPGFIKRDFALIPPMLKAKLLRNRYLTMIKNDEPRDFIRNLPYILAYELKVWAYVTLFSIKTIPEFIRGMKGALAVARRRRGLVHAD